MMKKNIAIIIHKLYGGGAEHAACNLSLFLQEKCNVSLVAFDARKAAYPHTENTIDLGVLSVVSHCPKDEDQLLIQPTKSSPVLRHPGCWPGLSSALPPTTACLGAVSSA